MEEATPQTIPSGRGVLPRGRGGVPLRGGAGRGGLPPRGRGGSRTEGLPVPTQPAAKQLQPVQQVQPEVAIQPIAQPQPQPQPQPSVQPVQPVPQPQPVPAPPLQPVQPVQAQSQLQPVACKQGQARGQQGQAGAPAGAISPSGVQRPSGPMRGRGGPGTLRGRGTLTRGVAGRGGGGGSDGGGSGPGIPAIPPVKEIESVEEPVQEAPKPEPAPATEMHEEVSSRSPREIVASPREIATVSDPSRELPPIEVCEGEGVPVRAMSRGRGVRGAIAQGPGRGRGSIRGGSAPGAGRGGPARGGGPPVAAATEVAPTLQALPLPGNQSPTALPTRPANPQLLSLAQPQDQREAEQKSSIQSIADAAKEAAAAGQQIHVVDKSTVNQLEYSQREITAIHDLMKFFITKAPRYDALLPELTAKVTITLFDFLLEDEFASNSSAGKEILRENGMVIQFLKAYLKIVGGDFLKVCLAGLVKTLCVGERKTSFEIDPSRAPPDEIEANMRAFVDKMQQFMDYMTSKQVLDAMPPGIRVLSQIVSKKSQQYRPTHKNIYIGSFLMLRFINPALFTPENFDLLPRGMKTPDPIPRRNLVLISKVLQNISNGIKASKKEPWMAAIDLEKWQNKIYDWFDNITGVSFNPETVHEKTVLATQVSDLHALHCLVFKFKKQLSGIVDKSDQKDFKAILDRLGDYANKTAFEKLEPKDRKMVKQFLDSRLSAENPSQIKEEATYIGYLNVTIKSKSKGKMVTEKTILILGTFQVWLLTTAGKIVVVQNLLKLEQIKSESSTKLTLVFGLADPLASGDSGASTEKQLLVGESADVDNIILTIQRSYEYNYSGMSLGKRFKMSIAPPERAVQLTSIVHKSDEPCGGLVPTYRALCHFWSTPAVDAVCWDIEHLYANNTVLDFDRFTKLYLKPFSDIHAGPFFHALGYNRYFTDLILRNFKFNDESTVAGLLQFVSNNHVIQKLTFSDVSGPGLTPKMLSSMFTAITDNTRLNITHLDLSYTVIPDGPINGLYQYFLVKLTSFVYLDLTGCFKDKGAKVILTALTKNKKSVKDLNTLKWGETKLSELSGELGKLLSSVTGLLELYLKDTQIVLSELLAPMDGECRRLKTLDIANNKMPRANMWDGLLAFMKNPKNSLYEINIMNTSIPPEFLAELLCIPSDSPFAVKLAGNPLGLAGAEILSKCASRINCDKLDISDTTPTDEGLSLILDGLAANSSLTALDVSFNYEGSTNSETQKKVVNALCNLAKSICPLEVFKFCGADKKQSGLLANRPRLRDAVVPFLLALGTKATLTTLDMSGHGFGDPGAIALSRLIQQSHSLTAVEYDDNNITVVGLANISAVLASNAHNIRNMPVPMMDVSKLLQDPQPSKLQQLMPILNSLEHITARSTTSTTTTNAI